MDAEPHILVVDDNREIRDSLARYLARHALRVTVADGGQAMRRVLADAAVDLVVLDIMMPGEDGYQLCRHLRETGDLPIIMLTAVAEDTDRVVGLELGADDYVTKPFNPRELVARIRAVLRRTRSLPPEREPLRGQNLKFDRWVLNVDQRELTAEDGVAVPLSNGEFQLLQAFLAHPERVLSREQLMDLTRGRSWEAFDRAIDNQVSRLRRKIEPDPNTPRLIKTVWGGGYRFVGKVERV